MATRHSKAAERNLNRRYGGGIMTDDTVSNQRSHPDQEKCRTRYLGETLDLTDCLVENTTGCEFVLRLGFDVYCCHPDRRSFEKTVLT